MNLYRPIILIFFFILSLQAEAQIRAGARLAPGLGYLRSGNLKKYHRDLGREYQGTGEVAYHVASKFRTHFAFGGFVEYKINDQFLVAAEPVITFSTNKIFIHFRHDEVNPETGTGDVYRIASQALIRAPYFSIPLVCKYKFHQRKELYAFGGFNLNFHFTPVLYSKEDHIMSNYYKGVIIHDHQERITETARLRGFNIFNMAFTAGVGKVLNPYGRNILVDIRYSLPLTRSRLYANDHDLYLNGTNNAVFSSEGKEDVEASSRYRLNDFRMGVFSLSVACTLYKNYR